MERKNSFEIALATVREFIRKEEPFSYEDLCTEIFKRGGIRRVCPGVTLSDHIDELIENDVIYLDRSTHLYRFQSEINEIIQEQLDSVVL